MRNAIVKELSNEMSAPITSLSATERAISLISIMLNSLGNSNQWQMVSEKIEKRFRKPFLSMFDEAVISRAEEMMGDPAEAHTYLSALIKGIKVVEPLTLQDLGWCEEVNIILLWEAD